MKLFLPLLFLVPLGVVALLVICFGTRSNKQMLLKGFLLFVVGVILFIPLRAWSEILNWFWQTLYPPK